MNTIELTNKDINKIMYWCSENESYAKKTPIRFPFTKFIINYKDDGLNLTIQSNNKDKGVLILSNNNNISMITKAKFQIKNNNFRIHSVELSMNDSIISNYPKEKMKETLDRYLSGLKQTLAYINSKNKETKAEKIFNILSNLTLDNKEEKSTVSNKNYKYTYRKPKYTKITSKVYNKTTKETSSEYKRSYQRKTETWAVRGHWATSKTGKRFWKNGYIKGSNKKSEDKIYKL